MTTDTAPLAHLADTRELPAARSSGGAWRRWWPRPGAADAAVESDTDKFSDTAKRTDTLPGRPAAVYLYNKRRT